MSEEGVMLRQQNEAIRVITSYNCIPYFIIEDDLTELGNQDYVNEVKEIIDLYDAYERGVEFATEGTNGEYVPSQVRFKKASSILNKEARFLFANPPSFNVNIDDVDGSEKEQNTIVQDFLNNVLEKNHFNAQIIKAVKDCFIGKRCAAVLNFNETTEEISLMFLNSLEFIYKMSDSNPNRLEKFICFSCKSNTDDKTQQVWLKKTYSLEDEKVYVSEFYYDGLGNILSDMESIDHRQTAFNDIPAVVILNDGLIADLKGKSELTDLLDEESQYSKLANADMDIERKGMNPVAYTIDASESSTQGLTRAPGAFWDLQSDYSSPSDNPPQAKAGLLEPSMTYSAALKTTLDRLENDMYSQVDVPNINNEKLMGMITSGKTIRALYWGLVVRCDEKMLTWGPALKYLAEKIIEGGRYYPNCVSKYSLEKIPDILINVLVENNYPLPEDVQEEKAQDITEVDAKLMSKKAYLKKWRNLSDKEAEEELQQIKMEQDLLDNSFTGIDFSDNFRRGSNSPQNEDNNSNDKNINEDDDNSTNNNQMNQDDTSNKE